MEFPPVDEHLFPIGLDLDTEDRDVKNGFSRYVLNGRSGTSDRNKVGAIESIRGNKSFGTLIEGEKVIGSAEDIKNNAIIFFVQNNTNREITYSDAIVSNDDPPIVVIDNPSEEIEIGARVIITQGVNVFVGRLTSFIPGFNFYFFSVISGALNTDPITSIQIMGENLIRRWYKSESGSFLAGSFERLTNPFLMGVILAFSLAKKIINPRVIESSFGQLLTWTDGAVAPRLMNIDRMKQGAQYYATAADEQYINLAKYPPSFAPTIAYYFEENRSNFVSHQQFRYQYIYEDGQLSTWSPISKLSFSQNPYNYLGVTVNSGHATVKTVRIAVRTGNGSSDQGSVNPEWYIFNTTFKDVASWNDNTDYEVLFYGSEQLTVVSKIDSDKLFDTVPQLADHIEVLDNTQIILGAITEGYSNVDMNVEFEAQYRTSSIISFILSGSTIELGNYSVPPSIGDTLHLRVSSAPGVFQDAYYELGADDLNSYPDNLGARMVIILFEMGANYTYNSGPKTVTRNSGTTAVQATSFPTTQDIIKERVTTAQESFGSVAKEVFSMVMNSKFPYYVRVYFDIVARNLTSPDNLSIHYKLNGVLVKTNLLAVTTTFTTYIGGAWILASPGDTISVEFEGVSLLNSTLVQAGAIYRGYGTFNAYLQQGFKFNSSAEIGVVYYDDPKRSTGVCGASTVNFVPYPEGGINQFESTDPTKGFIPCIGWEIKNAPPIWAKSYQFVYKGSSVSDFRYFVSENQVITDGQTVITYDTLSGYDVEVGDELRVVAVADAGNPQKYLWGNLPEDNTIHNVIAFDTSTDKITTDANIFSPNSSPGSAFIIEVRKPKPKTNPVYFEIDQEYLIANPGQVNRYHEGPIQNQDPSNYAGVPAIGRIDNGDVYFRFSLRPVNFTFDPEGLVFIESFSISDTEESNFWDKGRVNIETPNQQQQKIGTLRRWGGKLFSNTQVNNLSTWDEGNYNNDLNARFGDITGMRQRGYTLTTFQWSKVSKNFIGRREVTNADGSSELVVTDSLLSITNPSEQQYGTTYPSSVVVGGDDLFFFDSRQGEFCVDNNANGIYPVSSNGANIYWRNISNLVNSNPDYEVISGFDSMFKDVYVTIKNTEINYSETIYFNATQKQWKSFVEFFNDSGIGIDWFGFVGKTFVTFLNGQLWEQNVLEVDDVPIYCNLFGIQRRFINEFITNVDKDKVKTYLTHPIHGNIKPVITKFTIPATITYPNGMYSELLQGNYKDKEGVIYADLKNDAYTKGIPLTDMQKRQNIAGGRAMKGNSMSVRMEWLTPEFVIVMSSGIGQIPSEKS